MVARIQDVAKKAGVSTATVSHVINGTRFVSESTKELVLKTMKELKYIPNAAARSLRSQKSRIIGLIIPITSPDTSSLFFTEIAHGIRKILKENGYYLMFTNSSEVFEDEVEQIRIFNSQLIDGLIIAPTASDHSYLNEVIDGSFPVVFIDRKPKGYTGDCVLVDNFKSTYDAIEKLIKKGHKRIGYIGGILGITTSDERFEGYKKALTDNGIGIDESIIKNADLGQTNFEFGYNFTKDLIGKSDLTALFVASNVMSMGSITLLQEKRIKIPEDIGLIIFDDYDWSRITNPPLSVIRQPSYEMGIKAAELILEKINKPKEVCKDYRLIAQLIERQSF